ncbi:hypothetical protein ACGFYV_25865 [Streptomyces sp. NPDC048297]|uniref:hypothetical protein n=1 Tax=Streptomyces sp. NPDC048297 TaxID=3365531 RepID=UPI00371B726C
MFKHDLLKRYLPQFGGMTGTQSYDKRVVYLDGYAGEGRYENGASASAEIALMGFRRQRQHQRRQDLAGSTTIAGAILRAHPSPPH